jgi:hypothetical protein
MCHCGDSGHPSHSRPKSSPESPAQEHCKTARVMTHQPDIASQTQLDTGATNSTVKLAASGVSTPALSQTGIA